jgi:hypothetical protein
MKLSRILFSALLACALLTSAVAQDQTQPQPQPPQGPPQSAPPYQQLPPPQGPPSQPREWVPDGLATLGQTATSRTEFTLDHSMLVLASKLDKNNQDLRKVIAGVNGVSVHSFRFPAAVSCDPATMELISQQYREAGWQHLLSKHKSDAGLTTDLWVHMDQTAIRDVAVLLVGARQLSFVSVSGSITPLDLLRLSGHFGIPQMDGGVAVPIPGR